MNNKFGYVLATKMLVEGKRKVRFMYREAPDNPQDSGWRFFCGDEDDSYVNEVDNIGIYDISTIIDLDSSIVPYLNSSESYAFEREDENSPFASSENFMFGEESN